MDMGGIMVLRCEAVCNRVCVVFCILCRMADGYGNDGVARRGGAEKGVGHMVHGHIGLITHPHDATSLNLIENIV